MMSDHNLKRYIVTLSYPDESLGDLQSLNSVMVSGGYTTTLHDDEGHSHELGTNSFGIISALEQHEITEHAAGLADVALHRKVEVEIITLEEFLKAKL
ncbi:type V toxin-antitoxin system endoribonuclease antitoxin GhoS [Pantoea sp. alder70]|uniref:type V toxin-antitoxin system endoribonuclease antitoxin GhoS n=2 Tax=Pantoea TaxID=53335 RepID=UPI001CD3FA11|nr:type V toxin-antitoxin system endoribonuclease antitoxin GhoS [Pantoea sp. alder70]MCA1250142.1 type V toxin-antitoxin system endoribonuclease antitoxin GhoS [Pantoea sp. alder70]